MKDSRIPVNRDCKGHSIETIPPIPPATAPSFIAHFSYEDGSERSFDGKQWKLTAPSNQAAGKKAIEYSTARSHTAVEYSTVFDSVARSHTAVEAMVLGVCDASNTIKGATE